MKCYFQIGFVGISLLYQDESIHKGLSFVLLQLCGDIRATLVSKRDIEA